MSDVVERIRAYNAGRNPELAAIKYQKMRHDPFNFFRGTCYLFYEDWSEDSLLNDSPVTWTCGDLHLQNFGIYRGKNKRIYFDINDFDESLLAPAIWDIARFAVSIRLAFSKDKLAERLAQVYLDAYTMTLTGGEVQSIPTAEAPHALKDVMQRCERRNQMDLLDDWTTTTGGKRRFKTHSSKLHSVAEADYEQAATMLKNWGASQPEPETYAVLDVVSRLSGLGSMGVDRYLILVEGSGSSNGNRLIELKQRILPAGRAFIKQPQPTWSNEAERVITLQSRLQAVPPAPLAVTLQGEKAFTVRELYPEDEKIDLKDFKQMEPLIETMGCCTAYAHLRGCGGEAASSSDDFVHFAGERMWNTPLLEHIDYYRRQVEKDYKTFCESGLGR